MKVVRITVELTQVMEIPVDQIVERNGLFKVIQPDGQQVMFPIDKIRGVHLFEAQEKPTIVNPHDGQPVT